MFFKHNRRITALITMIFLALLVFCLIDRQVRRALLPETPLFHPGKSAPAGSAARRERTSAPYSRTPASPRVTRGQLRVQLRGPGPSNVRDD
jgi:hypothetical protein